jgi:eukaryotic-like serine/threonine-protein kinase
MVLTSVDFLIDVLRDVNLLRKDQFDLLVNDLAPQFEDTTDLAKQLVKLGWLTLYQAKRLLAGRGDELVIGNYVILDMLGEGGMGKVFKARQLRLNRLVALKVIRADLIANNTTLKRFHREAKAAAQLAHPNIVRLFDADQVGDHHYLAMEYVEGADLACLVKDSGPLPVEMACSFIRQAATGLQHAHEQGMVHRDIKPSNLLVTSPPKDSKAAAGGIVKILDMGLARLVGANEADQAETVLTQDGTVIGTPDFMSPEQAKNSSTVDARSDIYSLGCTFYYLLTGQVLFPIGTTLEKLLKHQLDAPRHVQMLRPDIPDEVAAIVHQLLAKRPEDRFQNGAAVAKALEQWSVMDGGDKKLKRAAAATTAVPQALPLSGSTQPGADVDPFNFDSAEQTLPATAAANAAHTPAIKSMKPMIWIVGGICALALVVVAAILVANSLGKKKDTAAQTGDPGKNERIESRPAPKKSIVPVAKREMEPIDTYAPAETELVAVLNVPQLAKSRYFQENLLKEIAEPLESLRRASSFDPLAAIERAILILPTGDWDHPIFIVQGPDALPPEFTNWVAAQEGVKVKEESIRGAGSHRIYILPDKNKDRNEPTYAAILQVNPFSVVLSSKKDRVVEAIVRSVRKIEPRFDDPSVKTMLARYPAKTPALWVGLGVDTKLFSMIGKPKIEKVTTPRDGNIHALYATLRLGDNLDFDGFVEADNRFQADFFWRRLTYFFKTLADANKDPRVERIAGLFTAARELPRMKGNLGASHQWTLSISGAKLSDWFAPFFKDMPDNNQ